MHRLSLKLTSFLAFSIALMPLTSFAEGQMKLNLDSGKTTHLTIYSNQALVNQSFSVRLPKGKNNVSLLADASFWQLSTLSLSAGNENATSISWRQNTDNSANLLPYLVDKSITISIPKSNLAVKGTLVSWQNNMGMLRSSDGQVTMFSWQSDLLVSTHFSTDEFKKFQQVATGNNELFAVFNLEEPVNTLQLAYASKGLTLENNYRMVWQPEQSKLKLALKSTITNRSKTSYPNASLVLASGDLGVQRPAMYKRSFAMEAGVANAVGADRAESSTRKGNIQFISVKGKQTIGANSSTSLNLFTLNNISAHEKYTYTFNGMYSNSSQLIEHPKSMLTFNASTDLPAGNVQLYTKSSEGPLLLTGDSQLKHAAKGAIVMLPLGTAYTIDVTRKRLSMQDEGKETRVQWEFTFVNHKSTSASVNLRDNSSSLVRIKAQVPVKNNTISISLKPGETKTINMTSIYLQRK